MVASSLRFNPAWARSLRVSKLTWGLHLSLYPFFSFCSVQSSPEHVASALQSCGSALRSLGTCGPGDTVTGVSPLPSTAQELGLRWEHPKPGVLAKRQPQCQPWQSQRVLAGAGGHPVSPQNLLPDRGSHIAHQSTRGCLRLGASNKGWRRAHTKVWALQGDTAREHSF